MSPRLFQVRELFVALDRRQPIPLARQLEEQLREAIQAGRLVSGQQLPSTRMLAEQLGVSPGVVVRAYGQLGAGGYLTVRQGANPRVNDLAMPPTQAGAEPQLETPTPRFRYDLRPERPDLTQFPRQQWLRSLRSALLTATDAELGYVDSCGLPVLRQEIAQYLARVRGLALTADRVVITGGSTHAMTLIQRALRRRGERTIAFENPSHRLLHRVARRSGLEPIGIAMDADGICVDDLQNSTAPAVVVSPAHQFPTGAAYTRERRADLLHWAEKRRGYILEDDYDAEFRYDRTPVGALQGLAPERVVYVGSTSKTLAPGLRLGWAVLPTDLLVEVAEEVEDSMLHLPAPGQLAFADFVRRGEFDRHLRRMRSTYHRRRDLLVRTLQHELPQYRVSGIAAGLHVVLELPSATDEAVALQSALDAGLAVQSIGQHAFSDYRGPRGLLLGYGAAHEHTLARAAQELAATLRTAVGRRRGRLTRVA